MEYVIYSAFTGSETILNLTSNPYIDFSYLQSRYGINSIDVLTPRLSISQAYYAMKVLDKSSMLLKKLPVGGKRGSARYKNTQISLALEVMGISRLKRPKVINSGMELPDEADIEKVHNILMGRITVRSKMEDYIKKNVYIEKDLDDILQTMYLYGIIYIYPSLLINVPYGGFICRACGMKLDTDFIKDSRRCPECGSLIDSDEPLFACPSEKQDKRLNVKFKEYRGFTPAQHDASLKLGLFLNSGSSECLLWTVPGTYNMSLLLDCIYGVLSNGGKCAVVLPDISEGIKCSTYLNGRFPGSTCTLYGGSEQKSCIGDITICSLNMIKDFYKAFDLIIFSESPGCFIGPSSQCRVIARDALRDGGRIIYSTSAPDFEAYRRAVNGEISLVTVPLHANGMLTPEPRIVTYRVFSGGEFYLSDEIVDTIVWSMKNKKRVRIIAPTPTHARILYDRLMDCGRINREWMQQKSLMVMITISSRDHIYIQGNENILVFFADDSSVFDEKTLLDAVGISAESDKDEPGEVVFVGSKESDEMYNARMMMRFLNKQAWEMGYYR